MEPDQSRPGGDWRADARAAALHLNHVQDLPPGVIAALRALEAALSDVQAPASAKNVANATGDTWPVLTSIAQVHGAVFHPGTSTREVVEEAVRYYEFEQQPARVASRASVLDRFGAEVGRLTNSKPAD